MYSTKFQSLNKLFNVFTASYMVNYSEIVKFKYMT